MEMIWIDRVLRCDNKKLCVLWSPKAGCCSAIQMFLDYVGYEYDISQFIHVARISYENQSGVCYFPYNYQDYKILQVVRNSYIRAVSGYLVSRTRDQNYFDIQDYISFIPNNLSFVEFLETVKYQLMSKDEILDGHYSLQTMPSSKIVIEGGGLIRLENFKYDIDCFNKKHGISLNGDIHYDMHSHNKIYEELFGEKPLPYAEYYKDVRSKQLVQEIYGMDIETFGFDYPY